MAAVLGTGELVESVAELTLPNLLVSEKEFPSPAAPPREADRLLEKLGS